MCFTSVFNRNPQTSNIGICGFRHEKAPAKQWFERRQMDGLSTMHHYPGFECYAKYIVFTILSVKLERTLVYHIIKMNKSKEI